MANIDNLTTEQRDLVLRFLLYRMKMDTRGEMMVHLPIAYATLYPAACPSVIEKVSEKVKQIHAANDNVVA